MFIANCKNRHESSKLFFRNSRIANILLLSFLAGCIGILSNSCLAFEVQQSDKTADIYSKKANTPSSKLQNTEWWQVARSHQLDPYILYAVALIESAKSKDLNTITPWPWAINKSGKSIVLATKQEAHMILKKTLAEGNRHIDVGMMQINLHWHGHRVDKPEHLLNPVINLAVGAKLLSEAIQSSPNDLVLGIGRYHCWQNVPAAVAYGQRVIALADQIRTLI
jgi:hypothetical protein